MRIISITAGAAGMFCGSCLRDNTLAKALIAQGHDTLLVPTYTPLTTDETDASAIQPIFMGGVNVFLQQHRLTSWFFRRTPRVFDRALNHPRLLRWVGRFAEKTDYSKLGPLTESMLRGTDGNQRKEVAKLVDWLNSAIRPDAILMTNALLSGLVPTFRRELNVPILTTLQGDDIFLEELPLAERDRCRELIRHNDRWTAGYIATSRDYADRMAEYFGLDRSKINVIYPGIQTAAFPGPTAQPPERPPTIGFFARLAPEKGFHNIVDAFLRIHRDDPACRVHLKYAGWLGAKNRPYVEQQRAKIVSAGLERFVSHVPCPDLADKIRFFQSIDVMSVPTTYREPKGLSILEAWACGVPVVQPAHGSFPELVQRTGGGVLVAPEDHVALAEAISGLLDDDRRRMELGRRGYDGVRSLHDAANMAIDTLAVLERRIAEERR